MIVDVLIRLVGVAMLVLAITSSASAQTLYDRDPESWRGHTHTDVVELSAATKLTMPVVVSQRLNPVVKAGSRGLSNVFLYLYFPPGLTPSQFLTKAWAIHEDFPNGGRVIVTRLGAINPGAGINAAEAVFISASRPGIYDIRWQIEAFEQKPTTGSFRVTVVDR